MTVNNLMPVILIFLYILTMYMIVYYKNILLKKRISTDKKLKNRDPAMLLFCSNRGSISNLFNITIFNLIEKGYYKLEKNHNVVYIKKTNREPEKLLEQEEVVLNYCNKKINNEIKLKDLSYKIKSDLSFTKILNKYYISLKDETKKEYGVLDRYSEYLLATIISIGYFSQVVFYLYNKMSLTKCIFIAIPLTLITFIICNNITYKKFNLKRETIFMICSLVVALISCKIWINNSNYNYIFFHFIIALLTFMYFVFVRLINYTINTNTFCSNKKQKEVIVILNSMYDGNKKLDICQSLASLFRLKTNNLKEEEQEFFKYFKV